MTMKLKYFKIKGYCLIVVRVAELDFKAEKFKVQNGGFNMADRLKFSSNKN